VTSAERDVVAELVAKGATPCYVYFFESIVQRLAELRAAFGDRLTVSYAIKSNPNVALLSKMRDVVRHLDASSIGEVDRALEAGYPARAVSFSGPGKRDFELARAVELGVGSVVCESTDEVTRLDELAARAGRRVGILLRINPIKVPQKFGAHMSGRGSQFGIDEERVDEIVASRRSWRALDLRGFHIFAGSNCLVPDAIAENVNNCLEVFTRLSPALGFCWKWVALSSARWDIW
jgi:diaminopimelate decarboxylase